MLGVFLAKYSSHAWSHFSKVFKPCLESFYQSIQAMLGVILAKYSSHAWSLFGANIGCNLPFSQETADVS